MKFFLSLCAIIRNFSIFILITNLSLAASTEHACVNCRYGFRRAYLEHAFISQEPDRLDAGPFFSHIAAMGEDLRTKLIHTRAFGELSSVEIERDVSSSSSRNVASFAFIFLDNSHNKIGTFYFKPNATKYNIAQPFFFFSGRRHREYNEDIDPYQWDALNQITIKEEDHVLFTERILPTSRIKAYETMFGEFYVKLLIDSEKFFLNELKKLLVGCCKEDFFDYLKMREKRADKGLVCERYAKLCIPKVQAVRMPPKPQQYIPLEETKYFTHSEQFALYKMRDHLGTFMDACLERMGTNTNNIKNLAVLIYTRNTMCARCGHSIITDFCHTREGSYLDLINSKIRDKVPSLPGLPTLFLASASHPYQSHVEQVDNFEKLMRRETLVKDAGPEATWEDDTYSPVLLNRIATFEDMPRMIFHHHMCTI